MIATRASQVNLTHLTGEPIGSDSAVTAAADDIGKVDDLKRRRRLSSDPLLRKGHGMRYDQTMSPSLFCIEITSPPLAVALRCAGEIDISSVEGLESAL